MNEQSTKNVERMKAAFAGDDIKQMRVELSRGAHEIERLAAIADERQRCKHSLTKPVLTEVGMAKECTFCRGRK